MIRFNEEGRPLEPVVRSDLLMEIRVLQSIALRAIKELAKHDSYVAEQLEREFNA